MNIPLWLVLKATAGVALVAVAVYMMKWDIESREKVPTFHNSHKFWHGFRSRLVLIATAGSILVVVADAWKEIVDLRQKTADSAQAKEDRDAQNREAKSLATNLELAQKATQRISSELHVALTELTANTKSLGVIHDQTERVLEPLKELSFDVSLRMPSDNPDVAQLITKLSQALPPGIRTSKMFDVTPEGEKTLFERNKWAGGVPNALIEVRIPPESPFYPKAGPLTEFLSLVSFQIQFFTKQYSPKKMIGPSPPNADFHVFVHSTIPKKIVSPPGVGHNTLVFNLIDNSIRVEMSAEKISSEHWVSNGSILSARDILRAQMVGKVSAGMHIRDHKQWEDLQRLVSEIQLNSLGVSVGDGRRLWLDPKAERLLDSGRLPVFVGNLVKAIK